jgi:hypothetical protein
LTRDRADRASVAVRRFVDRVASAYDVTSTLEAPVAGPAVADLVISFDALPDESGWERYISGLARSARKVLVVILPNPDRFALRTNGRGAIPTAVIAPALWAAGRVREHAYLSVPAPVARLESADEFQAPVSRIVRRTARLHAFVVDTSPRTPQARLRLRNLLQPS